MSNQKKKNIIFPSIVIVITIFIQVWFDLKLPELMADITSSIQSGEDMNKLTVAGLLMLLCASGSMLSAVATTIFTAKLAAGFSYNLRKKLFTKVIYFSKAEINKFSIPSLIVRATNDVSQVQMFVVIGLQLMLKAPLVSIWAITKIIGKQKEWTITTEATIAILFIIIIVALILVVPKFKKMQKLQDELSRITRENLNGISVIRAYNAEKFQQEKFNEINEAMTKTHMFTQRTVHLILPGIQLIMGCMTLAIFLIGAYLIGDAAQTEKSFLFSEMVEFSQYSTQIIMSFMMFIFVFVMLPRAIVSFGRLKEVFSTKNTVVNEKETIKATNDLIPIKFEHVSFKYPNENEYVIKDISFEVKKGETVAIIGSTGSGKSTIANLIPRFYDVTSGTIFVNGVDVRKQNLTELRNKISFISQKAFLFAGTLKENINFTNSDDDYIEEASQISEASEFIGDLEDKYESEVEPGGNNFSGGQKQRISIARAIFKRPQILIFDDSFSALDFKTDKKLRKNMEDKIPNTTKVIVAQRIGTIINADKIIVLEEGTIAGIGKHEDLLETCIVYHQIAESQNIVRGEFSCINAE